jgi:hypothetical protein
MSTSQEQRSAEAKPRRAAVSIALTAATAASAVSILAGCAAAAHVSYPPPSARTSANPAWVLTRAALSRVMGDKAVRDTLRGSRVYEILQPGQQPLAQATAKPVVTFASATALENAVTAGQLPAGTYGVLYDPEAWSFTPVTEQWNPVQAATRAAAVAHAHGLRLIVAPALNLTKVLKPTSQEPRWREFLNLNLVGRLSRIADVVELQAQSLERDTATYTAFVRSASLQARAANPGITVLAGLSTNPPGAPVNSQHLTQAIQATQSLVDGYWLNIPGPGPRCPTCNAPRPNIAIQTLQTLH